MFVEAVVFLGAILGILLVVSSFAFHVITRKDNPANVDVEQVVDNVADEALEEINKTAKLVLDELNEKYNALLFVYQLMDDKQKSLENPNLAGSVSDELDLTDTSSVAELAKEIDLPDITELADIANNARLADISIKSFEKEVATTEETTVDSDLDFFQLEEKLEQLAEDSNFTEPKTEQVFDEPVLAKLNEEELKELLNPVPPPVIAPHVPQPPPIQPDPTPVIHPKHAMIKELQQQGLSLSEIARRLDMGQGEIQLIIGLGGR
ncbi:MAG: hypothetical protein FWG64_09195 [Firmicutes bacterium]|nr:hypothetical protein [Bacillota bacterium]